MWDLFKVNNNGTKQASIPNWDYVIKREKRGKNKTKINNNEKIKCENNKANDKHKQIKTIKKQQLKKTKTSVLSK